MTNLTNQYQETSACFVVEPNGNDTYTVTYSKLAVHEVHVVDLENRTCSCGVWQHDKSICIDVVAVTQQFHQFPINDLVDEKHKASNWTGMYAAAGRDSFPSPPKMNSLKQHGNILPTASAARSAGRPAGSTMKKRNLSNSDHARSGKQYGKKAKQLKRRKCSVCRQPGHRKGPKCMGLSGIVQRNNAS